MTSEQRKELMKRKIKILDETTWDANVNEPRIDRWLCNFASKDRDSTRDELHALHLLSNFMYFGNRQLRALLLRLYRDLFRYPIIQKLRRDNRNTIDVKLVHDLFEAELKQTRFLGVGNPSESGVHLLYYLRQETNLSRDIFINTHEVFDPEPITSDRRTDPEGRRFTYRLRDKSVRHYVFIDDLCGSGAQACQYSKDLVEQIQALGGNAQLHYYVLFATEDGIRTVRSSTRFDRCECVVELDRSYRVFEGNRYFEPPIDGIEQAYSKTMCKYYGCQLWPLYPLGYCDNQLLVGFHHNTPDNTLPIIWFNECSQSGRRWEPIFRRYWKM